MSDPLTARPSTVTGAPPDRGRLRRILVGALALSTILFVPHVQGPSAAEAASCTGWRSRLVPPPTIRVLRTRTGRVQTVDFRRYVAIVMASGEWPSRLRRATLEAGAVATKQYAWYYTLKGNHRSGYRSGGACYDVRDDTRDQLFRPERANPTARQKGAIDRTWALTLRKHGRFFLTGYRAGSTRVCAADATGWKLYAASVEACARKGWSRKRIQRAYYDPGLSFVWTRFVDGPHLATPRVALRSGSRLASKPARISWRKIASDSPVKRYVVQRRTDGGRWRSVPLEDPKATSVTVALQPGRTHKFRVHAVDAEGDRGRWRATPKRRAALKGPRDRTLAGAGVNAAEDTDRKARLAGRFRSVAFVARMGPGMGKAVIIVDGRRVATVDLERAEPVDGQLVWTRNWRRGKRRVVVVKPARRDARVGVDGFLVVR